MLKSGPGLMDQNGLGTMDGHLASPTIGTTKRTEFLCTEGEMCTEEMKLLKGSGMICQVQGPSASIQWGLSVHTSSKQDCLCIGNFEVFLSIYHCFPIL